MADRQQKTTTKRYSTLLWVILIIGLLSASVGGVAAYLSASRGPLTNELIVDEHPTITVNGTSISVTDPGYAVYLRAAVVVNWRNTSTNNLLAEVPVEGTDYTLTLGTGWKKIGDFYYYGSVITNGISDTIPVSLQAKTSKTGYALSLQIAAQTVQAVGQTDGASPVDAVQDAWGVSAATITGN